MTGGIDIIKAAAALGTFINALLLFDEFGLRKNLKKRQFDLVLDLSELVRDMRAIVKGSHITYNVNFLPDQYETFNDSSSIQKEFKIDKSKELIVDPEDFKDGLDELFNYHQAMLLPDTIKMAISEFYYFAISELPDEKYDPDSHALVLFEGSSDPTDRELGKLHPSLTFEDFVKKTENLVNVLHKWLREHSDDNIDIFSLEARIPKTESSI